MIKVLVCLIVAVVIGGLASIFWWAFDDEVATQHLLLPPCAVYGVLWLLLPEERERRVRRHY